MTYSSLTTALLTVGVPVSHYSATQKPDKYIVWAEDGQADAEHADNKVTQQTVAGTIDYFTKTENDPKADAIQTALNAAEIPWRLNSVQYEDDTGYIHFEWVWELVAWHG